ncbi:MAG TPA: YafY family protein [Gammaproteobacteria bacterium]|nr:YafY family protein [Gammaproteobacteria bacterium]
MRADRLLSILLLLQAKGRMTSRSLAKRLEVSERTILRDMDALSAAGVPVLAERGAGGGLRLIDGYQTKLTGLTSAEIQTLFLGRPPKLMADLGLKDAADAAWIKLHAALPSESREQAEFARQRILIDPRGWRDPSDSITTLPVLLEALWRRQRLRFVYQKAPDDAGERFVDPLGLVARGSIWYLVAMKEDVIRTYRVSRIRQAALLDEKSVAPVEFDLAAHWETSSSEFREKLPRYYATFLVEPSVMRWARYRSWRLEEESAENDRIRIRLRFDIEEEALQFALSFGAAAEVLEPAALRDKVLTAAGELVESYTRGRAQRGLA